MSHLQVVRASAGSGKTYRLTLEYLKLLFNNPFNFRRILAVTFTNKATGEMKSRILSVLYDLCQGNSSAYLTEMESYTKLPPNEIAKKAELVLKNILHNYSYFSVSTIDSFFQAVIRAFARETGVHMSMNVELDTNQVLSDAVNLMLEDLDTKPELLKWLSKFAIEKVGQGSSWNYKKDLNQLGKEVFKEDYQEIPNEIKEKLNDKTFLTKHQSILLKLQNSFEEKTQELAKIAIDAIESNGLSLDDFSYGKTSVPSYFYKQISGNFSMAGSRVLSGAEDAKKWVAAKAANREQVLLLVESTLRPLLQQLLALYDNNYREYCTAKIVLDNIFTLGVLNDISNQVRAMAKEQNFSLLSDASQIIHTIVERNDTPFLYEKTGNAYSYFMIDEFQDTSGFQWDNFRPLIQNSLAENNPNLIVGDVKQSIYRWRNGKWQILAYQLMEEFHKDYIKAESLVNNWRSSKNVIEFNNNFFTKAATLLQATVNDKANFAHDSLWAKLLPFAYADVAQNIPEGKTPKEGLVELNFFGKEGRSNDWKEPALENMLEQIDSLQQQGYKAKDIAILIRNKKDATEVVQKLIAHADENIGNGANYRFVSSDSLLLASSKSVDFIVNILTYMVYPNDDIVRTGLYLFYYQNKADGALPLKEVFKRIENLQTREADEKFNQVMYLMHGYTLYEIIEKIIQSFSLADSKKEQAYLLGFLDLVNDFSEKGKADIFSFLEWWSQEKAGKSLSLPEDQDAMRIITIHKSKGLEFKAVIIPFCSWDVDHSGTQTNMLWCNTDVEPFSDLPKIPVKYSSALNDSYFSDDYQVEKLNAAVDALNMLYVAFTRAVEVLIVGAPYPVKSSAISNVGYLLHSIVKDEEAFDSEKSKFVLGAAVEQKQSDVLEKSVILTDWISSGSREKLRMSFQHRGYFSSEIINKQDERVNYGKLMHEVLAGIHKISDKEKVIKKMIASGKITIDKEKELDDMITELFHHPKGKDWFSGEWKVKNEAVILLTNGHTKRPDRVMIKDNKAVVVDYKFGEKESSYAMQIGKYKSLLIEMGYTDVEAWLWYVSLNELEEV